MRLWHIKQSLAWETILILLLMWQKGELTSGQTKPQTSYDTLCDQQNIPPGLNCECPHTDNDQVVNCNNRNLVQLPLNIDIPPKVLVLIFSYNHIESIQEGVFTTGENVTELDLSYNDLQKLPAKVFTAFPNLQTLRLNFNHLEKIDKQSFLGLSKLGVLDLSNNALYGWDPPVFQPTPQLWELHLQHNPLINFPDDAFINLPNVRRLYADSTGLVALNHLAFAAMSNLHTLNLAKNNFEEVPTVGLASAPGLKILDLSENTFKEIPPGAFNGLSSLAELYLNRLYYLETIREHAFQDLERLQKLEISHNHRLSELHPDAFRRNTSISVINLYSFHLRQNGLETLDRDTISWHSLRDLDLRENPWLCDCRLQWMAGVDMKEEVRTSTKCANPYHFRDTLIVNIPAQEFKCGPMMSQKGLSLSMGLLVAGIVICVIVIAVLLFYRRICCAWAKGKAQKQYGRVFQEKDNLDLEWDGSVI